MGWGSMGVWSDWPLSNQVVCPLGYSEGDSSMVVESGVLEVNDSSVRTTRTLLVHPVGSHCLKG